ncbi:MAG: YHS domain-containing protein, partial [Bacteroidia bacterium]|nr:YHS domain-containing protein [Bacteroidia bacterium]
LMHEEAALHKGCYKEVEFSNSVDFICNMELSLGVSDTAHYKGQVFGFCSQSCKNHFIAQPEEHLKKLNPTNIKPTE